MALAVHMSVSEYHQLEDMADAAHPLGTPSAAEAAAQIIRDKLVIGDAERKAAP